MQPRVAQPESDLSVLVCAGHLGAVDIQLDSAMLIVRRNIPEDFTGRDIAVPISEGHVALASVQPNRCVRRPDFRLPVDVMGHHIAMLAGWAACIQSTSPSCLPKIQFLLPRRSLHHTWLIAHVHVQQ